MADLQLTARVRMVSPAKNPDATAQDGLDAGTEALWMCGTRGMAALYGAAYGWVRGTGETGVEQLEDVRRERR